MNYIKRKLICFLVKDLFKVMREQDVLRSAGNGNLIVRGKEMSKHESVKLKRDARELLNSFVLESILADMDYFACKKIYFDSSNKNQLALNQMILYYNNILRTKLVNLGSSQK